MSQSVGDVLLVGSVPLDSAEDVFKTCADSLGDRLKLYPDGEVGARKSWIQCQAKLVFDHHPAIDTVKRPRSADGFPQDYGDNWVFRLKSSTEVIQFDDLKYAGWASESYSIFDSLRARGIIPRGARFQVSLPTPVGGCASFFDQPRDRERVLAAYAEAMMRGVAEICSRIPHHDLAIQWDVAVEVLEIAAAEQAQTLAGEGKFASLLPGDPWTRAAAQFEQLSAAIPPAVLLGFHFCYGDLAHHHLLEPKDLALSVRMANLALSHSPRPVSWIHMPVPIDRADDTYFAPLRELVNHGAAVFLGLIHLNDGVEGSVNRAKAAKRYLQEFGVATECGLGRRPPETLPDVLRIHREVADRLPPQV